MNKYKRKIALPGVFGTNLIWLWSDGVKSELGLQ